MQIPPSPTPFRTYLPCSVRAILPPTNQPHYHNREPRQRSPYTYHNPLNKHPLTPPLDELIQHQTHIRQHEATDIKPEKLSRMARGKFQPHVRLRAVLEPWVLDLARDLVYETKLAKENR